MNVYIYIDDDHNHHDDYHVGIEQYLQHYPDGGFWVGQNFVFDKREAVSVDNKNGVGGIVQSSKQQQQQQKQPSKNCNNSSTNNTDDNINNKNIIDDDDDDDNKRKKRKLNDDPDDKNNNNNEVNDKKNIDIKRISSKILGEILVLKGYYKKIFHDDD
jgi:predicted sulfurtransferase